MAESIVMPQLGESVVEGTIAEWFVKPGDTVEVGQALVEVETDKANTEVPATKPGVVVSLLVAEGDTVEVGTPILEMGEPGEKSAPAAAPADAPAPSKGASPPAGEPAPGKPNKTAPAKTASAKADTEQRTEGNGETPWNSGGGVATPTSGRMVGGLAIGGAGRGKSKGTSSDPGSAAAKTSKTSAANVGTGAFGAPAGGQYFRPPVVKANAEDTVVKFTKRRGIIAEHMVYSKHVSPHVPCFAEVDMTKVVDLRRANKARFREQGVSLTVLSFLLKATTDALREFPNVNAVVGAGEVIQRGRINLGIAVETDGGLLVPVIRDADRLSVGGLARSVGDLATKARDKKITIDDLTGGTFTVSNPGRKGNLFGAAIINQPQAGILRMGEIVRRPVVRAIDGEEVITIRSMMFLSLSYDHRIIDGVNGNGFLYRVRELLEEGNFSL